MIFSRSSAGKQGSTISIVLHNEVPEAKINETDLSAPQALPNSPKKQRLAVALAELGLKNANQFHDLAKRAFNAILFFENGADIKIEQGQANLLKDVKSLKFFKVKSADRYRVDDQVLRAIERKFKMEFNSLGDRCSIGQLASYWLKCQHELASAGNSYGPEAFFDRGYSLVGKTHGNLVEDFRKELAYNLKLLNASLEAAVLPMINELPVSTESKGSSEAIDSSSRLSRERLQSAGYLFPGNFPSFHLICRFAPAEENLGSGNSNDFDLHKIIDYLSNCRSKLTLKLSMGLPLIGLTQLARDKIAFSKACVSKQSYSVNEVLAEVNSNLAVVNKLAGREFVAEEISAAASTPLELGEQLKAAFEKKQRLCPLSVLSQAGMALTPDFDTSFYAWCARYGVSVDPQIVAARGIPLAALEEFLLGAEKVIASPEFTDRRVIGVGFLRRTGIPFVDKDGEVRTLVGIGDLIKQLRFNRVIVAALSKTSEKLAEITDQAAGDSVPLTHAFGYSSSGEEKLTQRLLNWCNLFEISDLKELHLGLAPKAFLSIYLSFAKDIAAGLASVGLESLSLEHAHKLSLPIPEHSENRVRFSLQSLAKHCEELELALEEGFNEPFERECAEIIAVPKRENAAVTALAKEQNGPTFEDLNRWQIASAKTLTDGCRAWVASHDLTLPQRAEDGAQIYPLALINTYLEHCQEALDRVLSENHLIITRAVFVTECLPIGINDHAHLRNARAASKLVGDMRSSLEEVEIARQISSSSSQFTDKELPLGVLIRQGIVQAPMQRFQECLNLFRARSGLPEIGGDVSSLNYRDLACYYNYCAAVLSRRGNATIYNDELHRSGIWFSEISEDSHWFQTRRVHAEIRGNHVKCQGLVDGSLVEPVHVMPNSQYNAQTTEKMAWRSNTRLESLFKDSNTFGVQWADLPLRGIDLPPSSYSRFINWLGSYGILLNLDAVATMPAPYEALSLWFQDSSKLLIGIAKGGGQRLGSRAAEDNFLPTEDAKTFSLSELASKCGLWRTLAEAPIKTKQALDRAAADDFAESYSHRIYAKARIRLDSSVWKSVEKWQASVGYKLDREARLNPDVRVMHAFFSHSINICTQLVAAGKKQINKNVRENLGLFCPATSLKSNWLRTSTLWRRANEMLVRLDSLELIKIKDNMGPDSGRKTTDLQQAPKRFQQVKRAPLRARIVDLAPTVSERDLFVPFWKLIGKSFPEDWGIEGRPVSATAEAARKAKTESAESSKEEIVAPPRGGRVPKASARFFRGTLLIDDSTFEDGPVASEEERAIVWKIASKYNSHIKSVSYKANNKLPPSSEVDDIFQNSVLGLIDAIYSYDPNLGLNLTTYIRTRMNFDVTDKNREEDFVPRLVRSRTDELEKAENRYRLKYGFTPTEDELTQEFGKTAKHWALLIEERCRKVLDANAPIKRNFGDKEVYLSDSVGYNKLEDTYLFEHGSRAAKELIALAPKDFQEFLTEYFVEDLTLKEIAARHDYSESAMSLKLKEVLPILRAKMLPFAASKSVGSNPQLNSKLEEATMAESGKNLSDTDEPAWLAGEEADASLENLAAASPAASENSQLVTATPTPTPIVPAAAPIESKVAHSVPHFESDQPIEELFPKKHASALRFYVGDVKVFVEWVKANNSLEGTQLFNPNIIATTSREQARAFLSHLCSQDYSLASVRRKLVALKLCYSCVDPSGKNPWSDLNLTHLGLKLSKPEINPSLIPAFQKWCLESEKRNSRSAQISGAFIAILTATQLKPGSVKSLKMEAIERDSQGNPKSIGVDGKKVGRDFTEIESTLILRYLNLDADYLVGDLSGSLWKTKSGKTISTRSLCRHLSTCQEAAPQFESLNYQSIATAIKRESANFSSAVIQRIGDESKNSATSQLTA